MALFSVYNHGLESNIDTISIYCHTSDLQWCHYWAVIVHLAMVVITCSEWIVHFALVITCSEMIGVTVELFAAFAI